MSSFEFEEPQSALHTIDISGAISNNTPLLIRYGIVKNLEVANNIMIGSFILLIIASIVVWNLRPSASDKKYREDFSEEELRSMLPDTVNSLPTKPQ